MIETERLILRAWRDEDREPFARMNADPRVMEFFVATMTPAETDALITRYREHWRTRGYGMCAVDRKLADGAHEFIGYIGLARVRYEIDFTPVVEVGWRLAPHVWGQGLATEGARAALAYGFETLGLDEIIAFTATTNVRSRRVMDKIGMTHDPRDDFNHPNIQEGHPLRRQVLYRSRRLAAH
jgi:3-dehydroquinate dehydratase/shikimate dehydrogenase